MKKLIITSTILLISAASFAQSKPAPKPLTDDTVYHTQTYKDMVLRTSTLNNLIFVVKQPGDVTPNQKDALLRQADSLLKVDVAQLNKIEVLKKKK